MEGKDLGDVFDVFCGAGGLSRGFSKAHFNIISGLDNNSHSIESFAENHDCTPLCADIREPDIFDKIRDSIELNGSSVSNIDFVIGGPPCQGFSIAKAEKNTTEHPLNELPSRFIDIVEFLSPTGVVMENVPRILTMGEGQYKESISSKFRDLGYNVEYGVLKAEEFGVPQKRRRAFFLAHKLRKPSLPQPDQFKFDFSLPVSVQEAISDLPELPTGGGGSIEMDYVRPASGISEYAKSMRENEDDSVVFNHRTTRNREKTYQRFKHIPQGGNWKDIPEDLMGNYSNREKTHDHIYQRLVENDPAKTVANFRKQMMVHPTQDRLLSVREAARLQSFPDDYHFKGGSFNARQQMVGNAVPVNLAYSVAKSIARNSKPQELPNEQTS